MIHPHVKIIVQNHIKVDDMSEIMSEIMSVIGGNLGGTRGKWIVKK